MSEKPINIEDITLPFDSTIGVNDTFFADLLKEDDWSFIIKLHALIESVCTHLLLYHFKEPKLSDVISRLDLSGQTTGKIIFLEKLGFLGKENRRFIVSLSELRNDLVHNIHKCEFDLDKTVQSFDSKTLREFAISFSPKEAFFRRIENNPKGKLKINADTSTRSRVDLVIKRAKKDPKLHIWFGAFYVLSSLLDMYMFSDYKQGQM